MNHIPALVLTLSALLVPPAPGADPLPLHPEDLAILQKIVQREGLDAPPSVNPKGWPQLAGVPMVRFQAKDRPQHALTVGHNPQGRVTHLVGNGPLLCNEAFGWIAGLPELRVIRIDHNTPQPGSDADPKLYDGSGIAALQNSELEEIRIGHAFDDAGLTALAKVKNLRKADICHSKVTDQGVQALTGHSNLEEFTISSQGHPQRITDRTLAVLATLPRLKVLGLHETFVTYEGGLKHLTARKGRLEVVSLKHSLVLPADLEKLKTDLPGLRIVTSTPAEILAAPNSRGVLKWASPEAVEYLKSAEGK